MIVVALTLYAVFYAFGIVRARRRSISVRPVAIVATSLALLIAAGALVGPIDALADTSLSWHMVQHLVLAFVVAPLVLLGAPIRLALAALPTAGASVLARALRSLPAQIIAHPAFAWIQFTAVLYGAHFSPLYEGALEHPAIHALEHVVFLTSALVFWAPLLAVSPAPHAPPHIVRLLMLFLALPMSAFLGFIFYVMRVPLYAHYARLPDALVDQANAGAVMWLAGGAPIFTTLLWCVLDWGVRERRLGDIADRLETI